MKKIINGKVYDTNTATKVGEWDDGKWDDRLHHCMEDLYRKRTGEFFLHGSGGASTKYAVPTGGSNWSSGENIFPLTYEAAQKWAEEHLDGDKYEAIFGEVVEDDTKTLISLYLPNSKVEQYKRNAAKEGLSFTAYLQSMLEKAEAI